MKELNDTDLLESFVKEYKLNEIFESEVIKELKIFELDKGEVLCTNRDNLDQLFMLVKGKLKVSTLLPNGNSLLLRFNNPLVLIGDVEFVLRTEMNNHIETVNKSILIGINYKLLQGEYSNNPAFLKFLLGNVSRRLYAFSNATSLNLLLPVENRFLSYLVCTLFDENTSSFAKEFETSRLTEVAELLGTSYRHLNRIVKKFITERIIERRKGRLYVRNVDKLKDLAIVNTNG
ncbi:Crp/Fnr family transcriptional regulator [Peribacillus muralis]|uniref:Crp/Fnr family transcriptional regulator n=1 Tax=Peribacillus muralis TaxID=264697 RepID=UPI00366D5FD4